MKQKLNLNKEGQMPKPNKYTDTFKSILTCMFLSVRVKLKKEPFCTRMLSSPMSETFSILRPLPKFLKIVYKYHEKLLQWVGVVGQKSQNLVNVVCERPLEGNTNEPCIFCRISG